MDIIDGSVKATPFTEKSAHSSCPTQARFQIEIQVYEARQSLTVTSNTRLDGSESDRQTKTESEAVERTIHNQGRRQMQTTFCGGIFHFAVWINYSATLYRPEMYYSTMHAGCFL